MARLAILMTAAVVAAASFPGFATGAQPCAPLETRPYSGPLFDAMAQMDDQIDAPGQMAAARSLGIVRMALFPRINGRRSGEPSVNSLAARNPDFVILGSPKRFDMRKDLDSGYVGRTLDGIERYHYRFIGEILYTHGDKADGERTAEGERHISPLGPQTARLLVGLAGKRLPVMTHWEAYDWARDWPQFDKLYGQYPDQIFIWPHAGFGTSAQLSVVLSSHPNVWATLSKKDTDQSNFADVDKTEDIGDAILDGCGRVKDDWRAVLEKFKDRVMFATDAHKGPRWSNYAAPVTRWRSLLGQFPPEIAVAIGLHNAERLYGVGPTGR